MVKLIGAALAVDRLYGRRAVLGAALIAFGLGGAPGFCRADTVKPRPLHVHGNTRTREAYIRKLTADCLAKGPALDKTLTTQAAKDGVVATFLAQCLLNSKLFSDVKVKPDGQFFDITVDERWTLIPIPYLQIDTGDSRKIGLIVAETNFLGMGKVLAGGASVSNVGASYFGYYQDPSVHFTDWRSEVVVDHGDEQLSLYRNKNVVDGFTEIANGALAGAGYKWTNLIATLHLGYRDRTYDQVAAYTPPTKQAFGYTNLVAEYSNKDFHFYGNQGLSLRLNATQQFARTDDVTPARNADLTVSYERIVFEDKALQLQLTGGTVSKGGPEDAYRLGGNKGFRGIEPHGLWAGHYSAASVDLQMPLEFFSQGTWTIGPFSDSAIIQTRGDGDYATRYESYGIATYFFVKAIALPGLGIEIGRNDRFQGLFANATVGLSI